MLLLLTRLGGSAVDNTIPILKRFAKEDQWPPLRIFTYSPSIFGKSLKALEYTDKTLEYESLLPTLIQQSPIAWKSQKDADLFLVPIPLSLMSRSQFASAITTLSSKCPAYDEHFGADHIFIQMAFPSNSTPFNPSTFLTHPGHIITSGYELSGDYIDSWVYAKNILIPTKPQTQFKSNFSQKEAGIAFDASFEGCTRRNTEIRRDIEEALKSSQDVEIAYSKKEMQELMERKQFSIVTACESDLVTQFYDAVNALSIPIVVNNKMRFPFENELIDYTLFVAQVNETEPDSILPVYEKLREHAKEMAESMREARKAFDMNTEGGGYVWAFAWSIYMKLLTWLPIKRNRILDNVLKDSSVFKAA